jgi:hypothetical protein
MLSWPNWKCYVDWKGCDRKLSRQICITMLIRTDDREWCHDLIRGALWIGLEERECCHDLIWTDIWIGKNVSGNIQVQFKIICGFEQMWEDDVMT